MKWLSVLTIAFVLLSVPLTASNIPANVAPPAVAEPELPPSPAQERKAAISQGMLLATMAVVLVVLATVGGIAVYITRRVQATPEMKDL